MPKNLLDSKAIKFGRFSSRVGDFPNQTPAEYYGFTNPADNEAQAQADYGFTPASPDAISTEVEQLVAEDDRKRYGL